MTQDTLLHPDRLFQALPAGRETVRMLYSQGVPLSDLDVHAKDEAPSETDPRKIWATFAAHLYLSRPAMMSPAL